MKILISKTVLDGEKLSRLFKNEQHWVGISDKDDESLFLKNVEDNLFLVEKNNLTERFPELESILGYPDGSTVIIDWDNGKITANKPQKQLASKKGVMASRQVELAFSPFKWLLTHKKKYSKVLLYLITFGILAKLVHWLFWIPFVLKFAFEAFMFIKIKDMFLSGDLLPGKIISTNPTTVAVKTDLSKGLGMHFPILRIYHIEVPKKFNNLNQRIPIVGTYADPDNKTPYWIYFEPMPLPSGVKKQDHINQKMATFSNKEWQDLDKFCSEVEHNNVPNIYPIISIKNNWSEHSEPKFVL
jgi:hypothetical protein